MAAVDARPGKNVRVGIVVPDSTSGIVGATHLGLADRMSDIFGRLAQSKFGDGDVDSAIRLNIHWLSRRDSLAPLSSPTSIAAIIDGPGTDQTMYKVESFTTCPPLDFLVVGVSWPSSSASGDELAAGNETPLSFLCDAHAKGSTIIAIGGGIRRLAESGMLEGQPATAPEILLDSLRNDFPGVAWVERRWIRSSGPQRAGDGINETESAIWTSGGSYDGPEVLQDLPNEI